MNAGAVGVNDGALVVKFSYARLVGDSPLVSSSGAAFLAEVGVLACWSLREGEEGNDRFDRWLFFLGGVLKAGSFTAS